MVIAGLQDITALRLAEESPERQLSGDSGR